MREGLREIARFFGNLYYLRYFKSSEKISEEHALRWVNSCPTLQKINGYARFPNSSYEHLKGASSNEIARFLKERFFSLGKGKNERERYFDIIL